MLYALRKLIAFVFLGGIFWFIYSDPAEIGSPVFMHALGVLTVLFALVWLLVPELVVQMRIQARRRQNKMRFAEWRAARGERPLAPLPGKPRIVLSEGEVVYWHEKGTLYVVPKTGFDEISVRGKPGDVAFPRVRRNRRKIQRTHCYFTDRRILFLGKALSYATAYSEIKRVIDKPGGLVFVIDKAGREVTLAFTFQNPLIAAECLRRLTSSAEPRKDVL